MKALASQFRDDEFQATCQTFIVQETSPGIYNFGYGGYDSSHVGMCEWGNKHARTAAEDDVRWSKTINPLGYRAFEAPTQWGAALATYVMNGKTLFDHEAYFCYQDRHRVEAPQRGWTQTLLYHTSPWSLQMWDAYRDQYN